MHLNLLQSILTIALYFNSSTYSLPLPLHYSTVPLRTNATTCIQRNTPQGYAAYRGTVQPKRTHSATLLQLSAPMPRWHWNAPLWPAHHTSNPELLLSGIKIYTEDACSLLLHAPQRHMQADPSSCTVWRDQSTIPVEHTDNSNHTKFIPEIPKTVTLGGYTLSPHMQHHQGTTLSNTTLAQQHLQILQAKHLAMLPTTSCNPMQPLTNDRYQKRAHWLFVAGFRGTADDMLAQLHHFTAMYDVPLTSEAADIVEREANRPLDEKTGHALDGAILSTHSKRSILLPLTHECVFAANPEVATLYCDHLHHIYPLRMVLALPGDPGHRGHTHPHRSTLARRPRS